MENNENITAEQEVTEEIQDNAVEECEAPIEDETAALQASLDETKDRMLRLAAEFDNFKKRTAKEKEELYSSAVCETVNEFLPVLDNLERAVGTFGEAPDAAAVLDGVKMILKQLGDTLGAIGVEKIPVDSGFDPELHNAVMHIEDESLGEGEIAEELMKGYQYKGKVIRHSMVKVAN